MEESKKMEPLTKQTSKSKKQTFGNKQGMLNKSEIRVADTSLGGNNNGTFSGNNKSSNEVSVDDSRIENSIASYNMKASSIDSSNSAVNSSMGSARLDDSSSSSDDDESSSSSSSMLCDEEDDDYSLASSFDEEVAN